MAEHNSINSTTTEHFLTGKPTTFDRNYIIAVGFPSTREAVVTLPAVADGVTQYTVQTFRTPDLGDKVFITIVGPGEPQRVYLPPAVIATIHRQREALTTQSRKRSAKARAARDKKAGRVPAFLRRKEAR